MTDDLDPRWHDALRRQSERTPPTPDAWQAILRRTADPAVVEPTPVPRRRGRLLAAAAAIVVIAGITVAVVAHEADHGPTRVTTATTTTTANAERGRIVVDNVAASYRDLDGHLRHIEGSEGVIELRQGAKVISSLRSWPVRTCGVLATGKLAPGTYELRAWEIGCGTDGSRCRDLPFGPLDHPCRTDVVVRPGQTTTVEMRRGLDDPADSDACSFAIGRPTKVVMAGADLPTSEEGIIHQYSIHGGPDDATIAEGTFGTARDLVVDRALPPGDYQADVAHYDCPGSCPPVGPDGRPTTGAEPLAGAGCSIPFTVAPLGVDGHGTDAIVEARVVGTTCAAAHPTTLPPLGVPPEWSLRVPLPRTCGSDSRHATALLLGYPEVGAAARRCFLEAHQARRPMELESSEVFGGASRRVIWRTRDGRLVLVRPDAVEDPYWAPTWTMQQCDLAAAPRPDWIRATGCSERRTLPAEPA